LKNGVEITVLLDDHELPLDKDGREILGLIRYNDQLYKFLLTSYEKSSWTLFIGDGNDDNSENTFPIFSMPDFMNFENIEPIKWLAQNINSVFLEIGQIKCDQ
jgi:hypothetical protein